MDHALPLPQGDIDTMLTGQAGDVYAIVEVDLVGSDTNIQGRNAFEIAKLWRKQRVSRIVVCYVHLSPDRPRSHWSHVLACIVGEGVGQTAKVGHRGNREGCPGQFNALVFQRQQQGKSQCSPCRFASNDDVTGIVSTVKQPALGIHAIVDSRRERMLRCKPVVEYKGSDATSLRKLGNMHTVGQA